MGNAQGSRSRSTKESYVVIKNKTRTNIITTEVWGIDNYDWENGPSRPDRNMNGIRIPAGGEVRHRAEVYWFASHCPFGITFIFSDGSRDAMMIRQKYAISEEHCAACFEHRERSHNITYYRDVGKTIVIVIENTSQQISDLQAEQLQTEAKSKAAQNNFAEGLKLANEALRQSPSDGLRSQINETITDISARQDSNNKAESLRHEAVALIGEAESTQDEETKKQYLQNAVTKLNEAESVFSSDENLNSIKIIEIKLEASELLKQAKKLENEVEMTNVEGYEAAEEKLQQAVDIYRNVAQKLEEGLKISTAELRSVLNSNLESTKAAISTTENRINDIENNILRQCFNRTDIGSKKMKSDAPEEEEHEDDDFQRQF